MVSKKIGEYMAGIGFLGFLIFASAIDGPGNDIRMVYVAIAICMTIAIIGATIADLWQ
jgi:hypothetical protein